MEIITDDTMREGLQAPGISFTYEEKITLAKMISNSGIERAIVSYPSSHISEFNITKEIIKQGLFKDVFALGRTIKDDIDLINETGSNISLHVPFIDFDLNKVCEVLNYAKSKNRIVEIAIVDFTKYKIEKLISIVSKFSGCGADIIQLPDTTGKATPDIFYKIISMFKREMSLKIEVHCHNDRGLSVANSIAALEAGGDYVDTTILGIGERNGIADTLTVASYLEEKGIDNSISIEKLEKVYDYLTDLIVKKVGKEFFINNLPIHGNHVNSITAGTHITSGVFPSDNISLNVYTGSGIVKKILEREGIKIDERKLKITVSKIKDLSVMEGRVISPSEVVKIYGELE